MNINFLISISSLAFMLISSDNSFYQFQRNFHNLICILLPHDMPLITSIRLLNNDRATNKCHNKSGFHNAIIYF